MPRQVTLERMQVPSGPGQVGGGLRQIEGEELQGELLCVCRLDSRLASRSKESFKPGVLEALNRASTVNNMFTVVKTVFRRWCEFFRGVSFVEQVLAG